MPKIFKFLLLPFAIIFFTACFHENNLPPAVPIDDTAADADSTDDSTDNSTDSPADDSIDNPTDNTPDPADNFTSDFQETTTPEATFITPKLLDTDLFYTDAMKKDLIEKSYWGNSTKITWEQAWKENYGSYVSFYEVGTIKKAPYENWTLVLLVGECDGPCFAPYIYRLAWNKSSGKIITLSRHSYSSEYVPEYAEPLLVNSDGATTIKELLVPNIATYKPFTSGSFQLEEEDIAFILQDYGYPELDKIAFTYEEQGIDYPFYFGNERTGCLYLKMPDGSISRYNLLSDITYAETKIVWDTPDEPKTTVANYRLSSGGCGIMGTCYQILDIDKNNLKQTGQTTGKTAIYEASDPENLPEKSALAGIINTAYEAHKYNYPNASFKDFLKTHPVLFWQDPFGRWSQLLNNESSYAAECGKPVIYLYPKEETDVSVQVKIDEFTETVPAYGKDGWNVRAYPDGKIYNYEDGKEYPYLFWEGRKKEQIPTDKGFVVERSRLEKFLKDSLKKLGLNKQERTDFLEFWQPRMLENKEPYFFISFMGTRDFNKVAPLTITPKPDTLIRVFMYYEPVNRSYTPISQTLRSIPRNGFTVIEWGGTSTRPWK
ncbi:hypothetical protein HYW82_02345 [Candidatus Peregrinibacteria bacterium]|nr:hypothetical protein [Candidatus Peregrinibacteria bacterium]